MVVGTLLLSWLISYLLLLGLNRLWTRLREEAEEDAAVRREAATHPITVIVPRVAWDSNERKSA
jgi:hypothetical protein